MTLKILMLLTLTIAALPAAERISTPRARAKTAIAGIPRGAVETQPNTYSFTDARGQKWIYRETPFGISRLQDKPTPDATAVRLDEQLSQAATAVEQDGSIHFTRPGPFGVYRWQRQKTELNSFEQMIWNRELAKRKNAGQE
jgi:hypothetical protein